MSTSSRSLHRDLGHLRQLRYHRFEACGELLRHFHRVRDKVELHPAAADLWKVYDWLMCPLTFHASDFVGIAGHVLAHVEQGKELDSDFLFLLRVLDDPPSPANIAKMSGHENDVAEGKYDGIAKQAVRFKEIEAATCGDPLLRQYWNRLKSRYDKSIKRNSRGVLRRTLSRERAFDSSHAFHWGRKRDRLQITFDALCHRWGLYGFEQDEPLPLKLTANPTPHGTMIFIPAMMGLDGSRALVWRSVSESHKAHGARRQGGKLSLTRMQNRVDSERAKVLDAEAEKAGLHGKKRREYVLQKMGQDPRRIGWLKHRLYST